MSYPDKVPLCFLCAHLEMGKPGNQMPSCKAFPNGIPFEIYMKGYDHREPFRNEAVLFELSDEFTEEDLAEWEQERAQEEANEVIAMFEDLE